MPVSYTHLDVYKRQKLVLLRFYIFLYINFKIPFFYFSIKFLLNSLVGTSLFLFVLLISFYVRPSNSKTFRHEERSFCFNFVQIMLLFPNGRGIYFAKLELTIKVRHQQEASMWGKHFTS